MNILEKLSDIQTRLNAPKNQFNSFGKYKYRSCEGILEALKPLLKEHALSVTLSDEIVQVGNRIYVKATASLSDIEGGTTTASAYAREPEIKKGMDDSQITGAASSYARKYALNGLFCIDDVKDADATNDHTDNQTDKKQSEPKTKPAVIKPVNEEELKFIKECMQDCKSMDDLKIIFSSSWKRCPEELKPDLKQRYEEMKAFIAQALPQEEPTCQ